MSTFRLLHQTLATQNGQRDENKPDPDIPRAESLCTDRPHLRFLNLLIALEALFNISQQELRYRIARIVAVLLGDDRKGIETTFDFMRTIYDKRYQLVHTGRTDEINELDVWFLADHVREAFKIYLESGLDKVAMSAHLTTVGNSDLLTVRQLRKTPVRRRAD